MRRTIWDKIYEGMLTAVVLVNRNRIVLTMLNYPARKNHVNLNWVPLCKWTKSGRIGFKLKSEYQNLGDWLAVPIFEYMTRFYGIDTERKLAGTKHLYTIGSICLMGYQDATIWGSGILFSEPAGTIWRRSRYRRLDVRCVRGPGTKKRLEENGYDTSKCVMGDPGVLMPLIYQPKEYEKKKPYSVIVHMNKRAGNSENEINIVTKDWQDTIDQIYNSELIISSSLHGIILAEAYGIPAILLNKIERGDLFKYDDYYQSTGRYRYPIATSVEEALQLTPAPLPDVKILQQNLIKSFPVDLWEEN